MTGSISKNNRPIGVFDSGIGGLTVVKQIMASLPHEQIIYFGDTARVPYGSKSNETVIEYSLQNSRFLISKDVKAIVVACNTASSIALPALKKEFDIPVIGMIEPGAALALRSTVNRKIGVIGTRVTVSNKAYSTEIHTRNADALVYEKACPLFVPLAEEGWLDHEATELIAYDYLSELKQNDIDTLILGCTHYPLLKEIIQRAVGEEVHLIDSGVAAAMTLMDEIGPENSSAEHTPPVHHFYVSDLPERFKDAAERFLGKEISALEKVELDTLIRLHSTKRA